MKLCKIWDFNHLSLTPWSWHSNLTKILLRCICLQRIKFQAARDIGWIFRSTMGFLTIFLSKQSVLCITDSLLCGDLKKSGLHHHYIPYMYITVILNIIYSRSRQNNIQCKNAIHSIFDTHNYLWLFCSLRPRYMQNYGMKRCEPSCTSTVTINLLNVHVFFWLTLGKLQYHTRRYTAWPPRVLHDKFQNLFLGGEVVGRCVEALKSKVKVLHEKFQIWKRLPPPNWGNIRILGKKLILQVRWSLTKCVCEDQKISITTF